MGFDLNELARRTLADYDALTPCQIFVQPLDLAIRDAYALQTEITRLREQRGEKVIGYKVGCTSAAMQKQLGINEPIFAAIFDTGRYPSGAKLSYRRFANLAVEGELAVELGRDLPGPIVAAAECRAAIASVFPVIELHNYVPRSQTPSVAELVASGGMHAGFVRDERQTIFGLADVQSLTLWIEDRPVGKVEAAELTRVAVQSVSWLASRLADSGLMLTSGQIVLTGSLLNLFPIKSGSMVAVTAPPVGRSSAAIGP